MEAEGAFPGAGVDRRINGGTARVVLLLQATKQGIEENSRRCNPPPLPRPNQLCQNLAANMREWANKEKVLSVPALAYSQSQDRSTNAAEVAC